MIIPDNVLQNILPTFVYKACLDISWPLSSATDTWKRRIGFRDCKWLHCCHL